MGNQNHLGDWGGLGPSGGGGLGGGKGGKASSMPTLRNAPAGSLGGVCVCVCECARVRERLLDAYGVECPRGLLVGVYQKIHGSEYVLEY